MCQHDSGCNAPEGECSGACAKAGAVTPVVTPRKHSHYFKNVSHLKDIDVYRVLKLFNVTDPCVQHAVKKLLVAGGRGAGKDISKDIQEAMDSLQRFQEMRAEDNEMARVAAAPSVPDQKD